MKIRYPIGVKLISITTALLLASLGAITVLVSQLIGADVRITAEDNNFTINRRSAFESEEQLSSIKNSIALFIDMMETGGKENAGTIVPSFFERNKIIISVMIPEYEESSVSDSVFFDSAFFNETYLEQNPISPDEIRDYIDSESEMINRGIVGEDVLLNASPFFDTAVLVFVFTSQTALGNSLPVIAFFSPENISESFGSGTNSTYLVTRSGEILLHPDFERMRDPVESNDSNIETLWKPDENGTIQNSKQELFTDADGVRYFTAYSFLSIGNAVAITRIPYDTVFEGVNSTTHRNILLTGAVLSVAVLFVWFFSQSISRPIKILVGASEQIRDGNYDVALEVKTQDEVGLLTQSFTDMSKGLREREHLKDAFSRFINKELAERAMSGELALGGETKNATVFFSDIRSFTSISEKLEAHEVVEFLNEYLTKMVKCVTQTGGVVDKYIGDSVMAVWGAPFSTGEAARDAFNCVRAALMMRAELIEFNKGRGSRTKPHIAIGCGINSGSLVAGQIGSSERMEYTVIGDPVNLASRTEALNKPFGTDILITENTYELVKDYVLVEEMPGVSVKGKEQPVKMFAVVNMPHAKHTPGAGEAGPRSLAQVREMLGITPPDLNKVNVNEEEKKYKIQS
ncbi:MAG: adenylate/guanylate cyclase domain-containing protein [Treponemataceae bacterium]|nr:MAG: adenylate/guanylate cyclase domain-containing protein [Treponemataceae bacterium]